MLSSFEAVHWTAGQIAYFSLVLGAVAAFVATVMGTHIYVANGERAARKAVVTAAVRPSAEEDRRLAA